MSERRARVEFAAALALQLVGAAGALVLAGRTWQTIVTPRPRPLGDSVLQLTGGTVDAASSALALVALAGVVAVLATRGPGRVAIGVVLAGVGAALVWRAMAGGATIGPARARAFVQSHPGVGADPGAVSRVTVHSGWAALSAGCGLLVLAAGLLIALRGRHWASMSARYETPAARGDLDEETARTRASALLWSALDRGHDPTGEPAGAEGEAGSPPP